MDLTTFYLASVGVAATLLSICIAISIFASIWIIIRLARVFRTIEHLGEKASLITDDVREFVHTSKERMLAIENLLMTARGLQQVAGNVKNIFRKKRSTQKKGEPDDE